MKVRCVYYRGWNGWTHFLIGFEERLDLRRSYIGAAPGNPHDLPRNYAIKVGNNQDRQHPALYKRLLSGNNPDKNPFLSANSILCGMSLSMAQRDIGVSLFTCLLHTS